MPPVHLLHNEARWAHVTAFLNRMSVSLVELSLNQLYLSRFPLSCCLCVSRPFLLPLQPRIAFAHGHQLWSSTA